MKFVMIKRTLQFNNPAYLSLKEGQLVIELPGLKGFDEKLSKKSVPIEDIGLILLDHSQITISHSCISVLVQNIAVIITCDPIHHPNGMILPIEGNNTQSERFRLQLEASLPLKNNCGNRQTKSR